MKKVVIISLALIFTLAACDLSSLNENKKQPSSATAKSLLIGAEFELGDLLHEHLFKVWSQQEAQTTYIAVSDYNVNPGTSGLSVGGEWETLYREVLMNLKNAEDILRKQKVAASEEAIKKNKIATVIVMKVLAYSKLVDLYGNVPFTEALIPSNPSPKYDDASTIYSSLIDSLNTAISDFNTAAGGFSEGQSYYKGNVEKLKKFANSLKMRLGITIADANPAKAEKTVEEASPHAFQSNDDNALLRYTSTPPHTNPVWETLVRSNRRDYVVTSVFMDPLNKLNDPRRSVWFTKINGEYKGGRYGFQNDYSNFSHLSAAVKKKDRPGMVMSYSEVEFIRAEAAARGWNIKGSASSHYQKAITANMQRWDVPQTKIDNYLGQPSVAYNTASGPWRKKIGIQKWLALYLQGLQAWTDVRRLDYPELKAPQNGNAITVGQLPSRLTYPIEEQTENEDNYNQASQAIGGDKLTTKIFWNTRGVF